MTETDQVVWVCTACGQSAEDRSEISDVSCYMNSVPVKPESIVRDSEGRVIRAEAVQ